MDGVLRTWVAEAGDGPAVASLLAEFRGHLGRQVPTYESLRRSVERLIGDPDTDYVLAARPGAEPAGICQLRYRYGVWHEAEDCWLEDLFVRESERRAGLGAELLEAALARAQERGCARVELDADSDNDAALALYRARGFSSETRTGRPRLHLRLML